MSIEFKRIKRIINPEEHLPPGFTHAANPTAIALENDIFRVFFNSRDSNNCSHIFSCDVCFKNDFKVLRMDNKPLFSPGELGSFDDSGVSLGSFIQIEGEYYLYYLGWNLGQTVPWRNFIGRVKYNLISNTFIRQFKAPVIDRCEVDPFSLSYPYILKENEDKYRMWYGSNTHWDTSKLDINHVIKYCESADGLLWRRENVVALNTIDNFNAYCRPSVIKDNNSYIMFFCFRSDKYRIGIAKSDDAQSWKVSETFFESQIGSNWESSETSYPFAVKYNHKVFFLYCGDSYGKTGFGIAQLS